MRALATRDEGGTLVGITHYLYHATAWSMHEMCYLQDLFVDPAARGRGHARTLIAAVAAAARARSARALYWQTHRTNAVAQRLYDTVARNEGFIVYTLDLHAGDAPLRA